ncbi:Mss4-like protein [Rhexocercosporidium sp. MPI-PUGE-AT-0058]|nr:Mss4-like protein [Rhexocercosporidium sp. MPI-PUGE-AT-0058]
MSTSPPSAPAQATPKTLIATCHCKAITLTFPLPTKPLVECHCSICRRYSVLWAQFPSLDVHITGETEFYVWGDKDLQFHRCKVCGCVTHWMPREGLREEHGIVSVNCRMLEVGELEGLEVKVSGGPKK